MDTKQIVDLLKRQEAAHAAGMGALVESVQALAKANADATAAIVKAVEAIEPPPPPATDWPCESPFLGPIRRTPAGKKVLLGLEPVGSVSPGLTGLGDLYSRAVYVNGRTFCGQRTEDGQNTEWIVDHSPKGIAAHARYQLWFMRERMKAFPGIVPLLWWDAENISQAKQLNVPAGLDWPGALPGKQGYVASYDIDAPAKWAAQAIKFQTALAEEIHRQATVAKIPFWGIGCYNVPGTNGGYPNKEAAKFVRENTVTLPLWCPWLQFGGPRIYHGTGAYRSKEQYAAWGASIVKDVRTAFGPRFKIIPGVWPRFLFQGDSGVLAGSTSANDPKAYPGDKMLGIPGGTYMLPPGWFGHFCDALLEAGADGIMCWSAGDNDFPGLVDDWQARWQELADLVKKRGDFVAPA